MTYNFRHKPSACADDLNSPNSSLFTPDTTRQFSDSDTQNSIPKISSRSFRRSIRFSQNKRCGFKKRPFRDSNSDFPLSSLSSKALLALTPLLLLPYSYNAQALSATTANTIQGTAPYIEQNGIKATDLSSLLSIKIGSKTYISNAAGVMQEVGAGGSLTPVTTAELTLANAGDTLSSVSTLVPANSTPYLLNNAAVIPNTSRKDTDGDGTFTIAGNIQGVWKDRNNQTVATLTGPLDVCNAPYTLTQTTRPKSASPSRI